ncbi:TPA: DUF6088 family protein [Legionella pneumophila]|uniref:S-adenosylhomocysteine hydrolase n=1 Tax=Legionella pneumophila (strain Lens) TaxID=297245 RepID=Q5X026_LEGPL|nr:DUF6088 family protein [Legionella pneumophila]AOW53110.1 hypothetical protein BE841_11910 [Legionella pneumophila subsp. pneumophila]AOW55989.1 hypothetical protein BE842_11725 [Legionella pneumophila subsp. pneumophila]AOW58425.1 hypothetical protein BE843_09245 [Legionella pneumophila subsp. pneumophila]AOW61393.1 hypothetical protein BE844_09525 [Legionella pneumophila subsp. pneumophila]AOW63910.1 hypothetical protein BE845_07485 [Legionella pneumophila subsp. pneumophila]
MTVKYKDSLEYKALQRIKKIRSNVVLRQDLIDLGSYRQVSRVFKKLMDDNKLVKIGAGVYAKAYLSEMLNVPIIQGGFEQACKEALTKKGIEWELSTAAQEYNAGRTTQVPVRTSVRLKSRYRGTLSFGKRKLIAEKQINAR